MDLKNSGNSILITDEEEIGTLASRAIMNNFEFSKIINSHRYILQFDLSGSNRFKCYSAGSEDFKAMMESITHYKMLPNFSYTDVKILGQIICGANLAIGYYNEHSSDEFLNKNEWLNALKIAMKLSKQIHQQFYTDPEFGNKYSLDRMKSFELAEEIEQNENEDENQDENGME